MTNMEQKVVGTDPEKSKKHSKYDLEDDNLGLDADHSSDYDDGRVNLNNDNDRVSHNPDGEDDDRDYTGDVGYSPLMDK